MIKYNYEIEINKGKPYQLESHPIITLISLPWAVKEGNQLLLPHRTLLEKMFRIGQQSNPSCCLILPLLPMKLEKSFVLTQTPFLMIDTIVILSLGLCTNIWKEKSSLYRKSFAPSVWFKSYLGRFYDELLQKSYIWHCAHD